MLPHPQPPAPYSSSFLFIASSLIERYNFYFQILVKRKIPGQKKYFLGFQKIFLDFLGFPGHTMKFQVFPGFPGPLATLIKRNLQSITSTTVNAFNSYSFSSLT